MSSIWCTALRVRAPTASVRSAVSRPLLPISRTASTFALNTTKHNARLPFRRAFRVTSASRADPLIPLTGEWKYLKQREVTLPDGTVVKTIDVVGEPPLPPLAPGQEHITLGAPLTMRNHFPLDPTKRHTSDRYARQRLARIALAEGRTRTAYRLHEDAGMLGASKLMDKWGWWPTFGLLSAAMINKEWFILNEELITILLIWPWFYYGVYLVIDTSILRPAGLTERAKARIQEWTNLLDDQANLFKGMYDRMRGLKEMKTHIDNLAADREAMISDWEHAETKKAAQKMSDFFDSYLEFVATQDQSRHEQLVAQTANEAAEYARQFFSNADTKTKNDLIMSALANVEKMKAGQSISSDSVGEVFRRYYAEQQKLYEAHKGKIIDLSPEQIQEVQERANTFKSRFLQAPPSIEYYKQKHGADFSKVEGTLVPKVNAAQKTYQELVAKFQVPSKVKVGEPLSFGDKIVDAGMGNLFVTH